MSFLRLLQHKPMAVGMVGVRGSVWREAFGMYRERWEESRSGEGAPYRRTTRKSIKAERLARWRKRKAMRAARRAAARAVSQ